MKRINTLFAALVLAATVAVVPAASAATTPVAHYIGAGSTAMFQGTSVAAYNDLALGLVCVGGHIAIATPGTGSTVGDACTTGHWSAKSATGLAAAKDGRSASIPLEYGNLFVAWVNDITAGGSTDVWSYLSVDSVVGIRVFLATPRVKLFVNNAATATAGGGVVPSTVLTDGSADAAALPNDVWTAISGPAGAPITAGMTDVRPEDGKLATERLLGSVPSPYGGDTIPTTLNNFIYSFSLGYGPGPIGLQMKSGETGSTAASTPVEFSLPGGTDPITGAAVSGTIQVIPVGEAPIIFVANRSNTSTGLGQVIPSQPACTGTPTVNCLSAAYTSDGSYQYRNVWDQHPFPKIANTFPNLNLPASGYCSVPANQGTGACHATRRPLGNLFSGGDCETDSSAFTWPLDANTQGLRVVPPNGVAKPITLLLRETLSGTYNTTEYTEMRIFGTPGGSLGTNGAGSYERPPYISQETNVVVGQPGSDPLNLQCPNKFGGEGVGESEGFRVRGIGTGEVMNGPASGVDHVLTHGVLNTPDALTYTFFSFGNVSKVARSASFGYLMIDGVDPLFADYSNTVGNPGQPAAPGSPLTWGELPACSPTGAGGLPLCTVTGIWGANPSYPHIRDGSYPAWSELRMLCDPADPQLATPRCTVANDPLGAESLIQNLQNDIHSNNLGGVPDLLPLADGGAASWNVPYGDASYVRQHYLVYGPDDQDLANGVAPWQSGPGGVPTSTHLGGNSALLGTGVQTYIDFSTEACSTGHVAPGTPANGPTPAAECGGDAGGFIVPVASSGAAATGNLQ